MIPTEYLRQVPIKHWLPKTAFQFTKDALQIDAVFLHQIPTSGRIQCEEVITGYKLQRAWFKSSFWEADDEHHTQRNLLAQGEEVGGFAWIDLPVGEP